MAKPNLLFIPKWQLFDNSGLPLSGGQLFFYNTGTTTKCSTYPTLADAQANTNANPNPIILNSAGRPSNGGSEIDIYVTQAVKVVCALTGDTDPPQSALWTEGSITTLGQTVTTSTKTTTYTITASDRDILILADASGGSFNINLLSATSAGDGFNVKIKKIDSSFNTVTLVPNGTDNIDSANSNIILGNRFDEIAIYNNGGTQWFSENYVRMDAWVAWTPGWTGFSAAPTSVTAVFKKLGKTCFISIIGTAGTSNTTAMTITGLPFAAARIQHIPMIAMDNSAFPSTQVYAATAASSTTLTLLLNGSATGWTSSGTKLAEGTFSYETV